MKVQSLILAAAMACAVSFAVAAPASAGTYTLKYSGLPDTELTVTTGSPDNTFAPGGYDVTAVSGTVNGVDIAGLDTVSDGYFGFHNVLYPGGPQYLDWGGIQFDVFNTKADLYSVGGATYELAIEGGADAFGSLSLGGAVPEPATWAMLILGVAMIGFAARRRTVGAAVSA